MLPNFGEIREIQAKMLLIREIRFSSPPSSGGHRGGRLLGFTAQFGAAEENRRSQRARLFLFRHSAQLPGISCFIAAAIAGSRRAQTSSSANTVTAISGGMP